MNKQCIKKAAWDIFIDATAGLFIGIGVYNFAVNANFPMAGFAGIALILYRLFHIPVGFAVILLNIPVSILCYRMLGKTFFFNSVRSVIITSLMTDYIAPLLPVYSGERLLAGICTGIFTGVGYAMIFMNGSSTAGTDFITMAIRHNHPYISLGRIILVLDCLIVLLGGFVLKDVDSLIYGLVITYIMTTVMDKLLYGLDEGKTALIITNKGLSISGLIDHYVDRGSTLLKGKGSYSGQERDIVMCACSNKEMYIIRKEVKKFDPAAFIVIMDSSEVVGEGFKEE